MSVSRMNSPLCTEYKMENALDGSKPSLAHTRTSGLRLLHGEHFELDGSSMKNESLKTKSKKAS